MNERHAQFIRQQYYRGNPYSNTNVYSYIHAENDLAGYQSFPLILAFNDIIRYFLYYRDIPYQNITSTHMYYTHRYKHETAIPHIHVQRHTLFLYYRGIPILQTQRVCILILYTVCTHEMVTPPFHSTYSYYVYNDLHVLLAQYTFCKNFPLIFVSRWGLNALTWLLTPPKRHPSPIPSRRHKENSDYRGKPFS